LTRYRSQMRAETKRTARINEVRGLLRESGFDLPQGPSAVMSKVPGWLDDESSSIPPALRQALITVMAEIRDLESRIAAVEKQLRQEASKRVPGGRV